MAVVFIINHNDLKSVLAHCSLSDLVPISGEIPVVQLNYAVISLDIGYERDIVEVCIKEVIGAFARTVSSRKSADLTFRDIGRLVVKEGKAKMKFAKEFIRTMDGSRSFILSPLSLAVR